MALHMSPDTACQPDYPPHFAVSESSWNGRLLDALTLQPGRWTLNGEKAERSKGSMEQGLAARKTREQPCCDDSGRLDSYIYV